MLNNALSSPLHKMLEASPLVSTYSYYSEAVRIAFRADKTTQKKINHTFITALGHKSSVVIFCASLSKKHPWKSASNWYPENISHSYTKTLNPGCRTIQSNRIYMAKLEDFTSKINVLIKT